MVTAIRSVNLIYTLLILIGSGVVIYLTLFVTSAFIVIAPFFYFMGVVALVMVNVHLQMTHIGRDGFVLYSLIALLFSFVFAIISAVIIYLFITGDYFTFIDNAPQFDHDETMMNFYIYSFLIAVYFMCVTFFYSLYYLIANIASLCRKNDDYRIPL